MTSSEHDEISTSTANKNMNKVLYPRDQMSNYCPLYTQKAKRVEPDDVKLVLSISLGSAICCWINKVSVV